MSELAGWENNEHCMVTQLKSLRAAQAKHEWNPQKTTYGDYEAHEAINERILAHKAHMGQALFDEFLMEAWDKFKRSIDFPKETP